ncbi:MAG: hypothetical protein JWO31_2334, partial [Phycisphaerales bacterium]|nr:hypothetical protein [Phycisphaerales bacterium]
MRRRLAAAAFVVSAFAAALAPAQAPTTAPQRAAGGGAASRPVPATGPAAPTTAPALPDLAAVIREAFASEAKVMAEPVPHGISPVQSTKWLGARDARAAAVAGGMVRLPYAVDLTVTDVLPAAKLPGLTPDDLREADIAADPATAVAVV